MTELKIQKPFKTFRLIKGGTVKIRIDSIYYFKSYGYITEMYCHNGNEIEKHMLNMRLGDIELSFKHNPKFAFNFFRSHRSYFVNLNHVTPYGKYPLPIIEFTDGLTAQLARRRKLDFHQRWVKLKKAIKS